MRYFDPSGCMSVYDQLSFKGRPLFLPSSNNAFAFFRTLNRRPAHLCPQRNMVKERLRIFLRNSTTGRKQQ
jgi:hypothetical protein